MSLRKYITVKHDDPIEVDNPFGIYKLKISTIKIGQNITMLLRIRDYPKSRCIQCGQKYSKWEDVGSKCKTCQEIDEILFGGN